eukprot:373376_1
MYSCECDLNSKSIYILSIIICFVVSVIFVYMLSEYFSVVYVVVITRRTGNTRHVLLTHKKSFEFYVQSVTKPMVFLLMNTIQPKCIKTPSVNTLQQSLDLSQRDQYAIRRLGCIANQDY